MSSQRRDRPYRQYEFVFLFSKSRFYSFDRSRLPEEDACNIPIERTRRASHNARFPTELVRRCIEVGSPPGGHVLYPFVGSGTTLLTALDSNRNCVGIDMNDGYVDYIRDTLGQGKNQLVEWKQLEEHLREPSVSWDQWAGNRKNFRKRRGGGNQK